jgi:hypothetical protein
MASGLLQSGIVLPGFTLYSALFKDFKGWFQSFCTVPPQYPEKCYGYVQYIPDKVTPERCLVGLIAKTKLKSSCNRLVVVIDIINPHFVKVAEINQSAQVSGNLTVKMWKLEECQLFNVMISSLTPECFSPTVIILYMENEAVAKFVKKIDSNPTMIIPPSKPCGAPSRVAKTTTPAPVTETALEEVTTKKKRRISQRPVVNKAAREAMQKELGVGEQQPPTKSGYNSEKFRRGISRHLNALSAAEIFAILGADKQEELRRYLVDKGAMPAPQPRVTRPPRQPPAVPPGLAAADKLAADALDVMHAMEKKKAKKVLESAASCGVISLDEFAEPIPIYVSFPHPAPGDQVNPHAKRHTGFAAACVRRSGRTTKGYHSQNEAQAEEPGGQAKIQKQIPLTDMSPSRHGYHVVLLNRGMVNTLALEIPPRALCVAILSSEHKDWFSTNFREFPHYYPYSGNDHFNLKTINPYVIFHLDVEFGAAPPEEIKSFFESTNAGAVKKGNEILYKYATDGTGKVVHDAIREELVRIRGQRDRLAGLISELADEVQCGIGQMACGNISGRVRGEKSVLIEKNERLKMLSDVRDAMEENTKSVFPVMDADTPVFCIPLYCMCPLADKLGTHGPMCYARSSDTQSLVTSLREAASAKGRPLPHFAVSTSPSFLAGKNICFYCNRESDSMKEHCGALTGDFRDNVKRFKQKKAVVVAGYSASESELEA